MDHRRARPSSRAAARVAAPVVAIALLLAACTSTPSPSAPASVPASTASPAAPSPSLAPSVAPPSATPVASEPPAETDVPGVAECEPADVKASHGLVEGGAGSRFTTVVVVASVTCSVDLWPAFGLRDGNGAVLVNAVSGGPGRIELDPDLTYQSDVRLANWCADDPAFPLAFELLVGGGQEKVTGGSFPEEGDLPPCNGEAAGRVFEAQPWEVGP